MWRPDDWPECVCDRCKQKVVDDYGYLCDINCGKHIAYLNHEAGADLMLRMLRERQAFKVNDNCTDVCIPNDREEKCT